MLDMALKKSETVKLQSLWLGILGPTYDDQSYAVNTSCVYYNFETVKTRNVLTIKN